MPGYLPCPVVYQRLILVQPCGSHAQVTKYLQHVVGELLIWSSLHHSAQESEPVSRIQKLTTLRNQKRRQPSFHTRVYVTEAQSWMVCILSLLKKGSTSSERKRIFVYFVKFTRLDFVIVKNTGLCIKSLKKSFLHLPHLTCYLNSYHFYL